ncbi:MAG: hypothetical protein AAGA96_01830 [Verrucomicrobiota bacterium]
MIGLGAGSLKIYVALEPQDLRNSFQEGLSELAEGHLKEKLRREALFVFTNLWLTRIVSITLFRSSLSGSYPSGGSVRRKIVFPGQCVAM